MEIMSKGYTDPLDMGVRETVDSRGLQGFWLATGNKGKTVTYTDFRAKTRF